MSCSKLDRSDCHFRLRNELIARNDIKTDQLCTSVAWDWMFLGSSYTGINEEIMSTLECVELLQRKGHQSLAIPQLSLLELAKYHLAKIRYYENQRSLSVSNHHQKQRK